MKKKKTKIRIQKHQSNKIHYSIHRHVSHDIEISNGKRKTILIYIYIY